MHLNEDCPAFRFQIQGVEPGSIKVDGRPYTHSLLLSAETLLPWAPPSIEALTLADIQTLLNHLPSSPSPLAAFLRPIVLIGTGPLHRFLAPALVAPLMQAGIGFEVMSTRAAAHSYTLLRADNRPVLAALCVH